MTRPLSATVHAAVNASETDKVFIYLVTLDRADLEVPIRITTEALVNIGGDNYGVISRGLTFVYLPFELSLPEQSEDGVYRAKFDVDNVSRDIALALRDISSPASAKVEIILHHAPDVVEATIDRLYLRNVQIDVNRVSGDFMLDLTDNEVFPAGRFLPSTFPGLF